MIWVNQNLSEPGTPLDIQPSLSQLQRMQFHQVLNRRNHLQQLRELMISEIILTQIKPLQHHFIRTLHLFIFQPLLKSLQSSIPE